MTCDDGTSSSGAFRLPYRKNGGGCQTAFTPHPHQMHRGIDYALGEIAAERPDQHGPDALPTAVANADRQCEGQDHDEAEEYLARALDRIQHAIAWASASECGLAVRGA